MLLRLNEQVIQLALPFRGQVGAGTVVPFTPGDRILIYLPEKYQDPKYTMFQACGDSFKNEAILDGDFLVVREQFETAEVKDGRLIIVKLPCGDLALKRIYFLEGFGVKLCSANRKYKPIFCELDMIQVVALVDLIAREEE